LLKPVELKIFKVQLFRLTNALVHENIV
jgi:hypothetical protein